MSDHNFTFRWRGPWRYDGEGVGDYGGRFYSVVNADRDEVVGERGGPYSEADAQLIAAAPDLYRELQALVDAYVGDKGLESAHAALAKARGEQP